MNIIWERQRSIEWNKQLCLIETTKCDNNIQKSCGCFFLFWAPSQPASQSVIRKLMGTTIDLNDRFHWNLCCALFRLVVILHNGTGTCIFFYWFHLLNCGLRLCNCGRTFWIGASRKCTFWEKKRQITGLFCIQQHPASFRIFCHKGEKGILIHPIGAYITAIIW